MGIRKKVIGLDDLLADFQKEKDKRVKRDNPKKRCSSDEVEEKARREKEKLLSKFVAECQQKANLVQEINSEEECHEWGQQIFGQQVDTFFAKKGFEDVVTLVDCVYGVQKSPPPLTCPKLGNCDVLQSSTNNELNAIVDLDYEKASSIIYTAISLTTPALATQVAVATSPLTQPSKVMNSTEGITMKRTSKFGSPTQNVAGLTPVEDSCAVADRSLMRDDVCHEKPRENVGGVEPTVVSTNSTPLEVDLMLREEVEEEDDATYRPRQSLEEILMVKDEVPVGDRSCNEPIEQIVESINSAQATKLDVKAASTRPQVATPSGVGHTDALNLGVGKESRVVAVLGVRMVPELANEGATVASFARTMAKKDSCLEEEQLEDLQNALRTFYSTLADAIKEARSPVKLPRLVMRFERHIRSLHELGADVSCVSFMLNRLAGFGREWAQLEEYDMPCLPMDIINLKEAKLKEIEQAELSNLNSSIKNYQQMEKLHVELGALEAELAVNKDLR
ncbi:hypothetical protein ACLOJK_000543 [Asimina triloba]